MGVAYYIVSNDGDTSYSTMMSGKGLGLALDNVSCMGEDAGMTRLDDFVSHSKEDTIEIMRGGGFTDIDESKFPDEQWYDSKMGIKLVEQYIDKLKTYDYIDKTDKENSLQDLNDMLSILKLLDHKGLKWHLTIDI